MSLEKLKDIRCFIFDVDGVLTNGNVLVLPEGLLARSMNIKDGYALQLAVKKGYKIIVISGSNSPEVKARLNKLGVTEVHMQVIDKAALLRSMMDREQLEKKACLYMGDDIPDLKVMQLAGFPCCPSDAVEEIRAIAVYISPLKGGAGCARDVIEKVMKLRGDWNEDVLVPSR
ncbi:MAG TPA: HAD hydrolase family protein [Sediminibacterium sp.]|nr:HAD hydrolase family protein [Sediminibacterium sp.]